MSNDLTNSSSTFSSLLESLHKRKQEFEDGHALPIMVEEIEYWIDYVEKAGYKEDKSNDDDDDDDDDNEGDEDDEHEAAPVLPSWWDDREDAEPQRRHLDSVVAGFAAPMAGGENPSGITARVIIREDRATVVEDAMPNMFFGAPDTDSPVAVVHAPFPQPDGAEVNGFGASRAEQPITSIPRAVRESPAGFAVPEFDGAPIDTTPRFIQGTPFRAQVSGGMMGVMGTPIQASASITSPPAEGEVTGFGAPSGGG